MPIDSVLNALLSVLSLSEPVKTAVSEGVPTLEDLEDVFLDLVDDESKVRAMLEQIIDEYIVTHHDIRRIMFFSQWFMLNIADPDFQWSNFTHSVYMAHKRATGLAKQVSSETTPGEKSAAPSIAASVFDFSAEVLATDAKCQAAPVAPGTVATLKSPRFGSLPLQRTHARATHNSSIPLSWF
jgi:hypothetical protein